MIQELATVIVLRTDGLDWATIVAAIGTVATAAIALGAATVALKGVKQSRLDAAATRTQSDEHALQTRAHRYLERYNEDSQLGPRSRLHSFFMIPPDEQDERIEQWQAMGFPESLSTVQGLNFWEELSGMYNRNLVDRGIIDDYFGSEALYIWEGIQWFVKSQRKQAPNAMLEMQRMCEGIERKRAS
jgi:hypothetical protein